MSRRAPRSTPRKGSSSSSTRAGLNSQRPSATFCWLPPESDSIGASGPLQTTPSRSIIPSVPRCSSRTRVSPRRTKRLSTASVAFARTDHSGISDWPARSSGTRCTPRPIASAGLAGGERLAVEQDRPPARAAGRTARPAARTCPRRSARSARAPRRRAARGRTARCRANTARPLEAPAGHGRAARPRARHAPSMSSATSPEHRVHDLRLERPLELGLQPAVAQHRDAVGERLDLAQPVRDVEDRDAALAQPPHVPNSRSASRRPAPRSARRARAAAASAPAPAPARSAGARDAQARRRARRARSSSPSASATSARRPISERGDTAAARAAREAVEQQVLGRRHPRHGPLRACWCTV